MAVAVQADPVPGGHDLRDQSGVALDLLADQEEGRPHPGGSENLERRRGSLRVGTVVEGQRVAIATGGAIFDPQRPPQRT